MNRVPLWIKDIMMYRDLLKNYKLTTREKKDIKHKINKLFIAILTRRLIERTFEPSIDREKFIYDIHENKKDIEDEYGSPIEMLRLIANSNIQEQPGSLNKTYFYQYDKSKKYKFSKLLNYIYLILNDFFGTFYGFISKPIYLFTQNKLTIYINYYIPSWKKKKLKIIRIGNKVIKYYILVDRYPKLVARNRWKYGRYPAQTGKQLKFEFTQLVKILSNLLFSTNPSMPAGHKAQGVGPLLSHNKPKVVLQLRRLRHAYLDSTILSKFIALNSNKKSFRRIFNSIIKRASIITKGLIKDPNYKHFFLGVTNTKKIELHTLTKAVLTGLKVRISGRLITQRIIPKRTVQQKEIGNFKKNKDSVVDYAVYTNKNKRGAYTIKVWNTSYFNCLPEN